MRRAFALLPALLLIAAAPPAERPGAGKACDRTGVDLAATQPGGGFRRLDQLPPANEYLTVLRSVDGCRQPVIVRYDVGGGRSSGGH